MQKRLIVRTEFILAVITIYPTFSVKTKGLKRGSGYDSLSDRIKRRKRSGANEDEDYSDDSAADYAEECKISCLYSRKVFVTF